MWELALAKTALKIIVRDQNGQTLNNGTMAQWQSVEAADAVNAAGISISQPKTRNPKPETINSKP